MLAKAVSGGWMPKRFLVVGEATSGGQRPTVSRKKLPCSGVLRLKLSVMGSAMGAVLSAGPPAVQHDLGPIPSQPDP